MELPVFQKTIVDNNGNVRVESKVLVKRSADGSIAKLYKDKTGLMEKENPFITDLDGLAKFYAQTGKYDIIIQYEGNSVQLSDVALIDLLSVHEIVNSMVGTPLRKANTAEVLFKYVDGNILLNTDFTIVNQGSLHTFPEDAIIAASTLDKGVDYLVYFLVDGTLSVETHDYVSQEHDIILGGFSTHSIIEPVKIIPLSFWDINFKPTCNPRSMVYVASHNKWVDIYLNTVDSTVDKYNSYNKTIEVALDWFQANKVVGDNGKQLLSFDLFNIVSLGVEEATSEFSEPTTTKFILNRRSDIGLEQITGCYWQWSSEGYLFGGAVDTGTDSGSKAIDTTVVRTFNNNLVSFRGCAQHVISQ